MMIPFLLLQFVLISLSGWGMLFYGGYKLFTGGKGEVTNCFLFFFLRNHLCFSTPYISFHGLCRSLSRLRNELSLGKH